MMITPDSTHRNNLLYSPLFICVSFIIFGLTLGITLIKRIDEKLFDYAIIYASSPAKILGASASTSSWKTYTNNTFHFSLLYPPSWTFKDFSKTEDIAKQPVHIIFYDTATGFSSNNPTASWINITFSNTDLSEKLRVNNIKQSFKEEKLYINNTGVSKIVVTSKEDESENTYIRGTNGSVFFLMYPQGDPNGEAFAYFNTVVSSLKILTTEAKNGYSCPQTAYIDCMPRVPAVRQDQCKPEFLQWAQQNCPNFKGAAY